MKVIALPHKSGKTTALVQWLTTPTEERRKIIVASHKDKLRLQERLKDSGFESRVACIAEAPFENDNTVYAVDDVERCIKALLCLNVQFITVTTGGSDG